MDFFAQQDQARSRTGLLVVLYVLAIVLIVVSVYIAVQVGLNSILSDEDTARPFAVDWTMFGWVSLVTVVIILAGSTIKIIQLSGGGQTVAEGMGGRLVNSGTPTRLERRFINIVEEMALASGVPVPDAYVLDQEAGINAFAAGYSPGDAVVAVTRGCLEKLNRDELQGVIAHEYSHILNGDMRLNIRLIGLLCGIMVIANIGQAILRGGSRSRSKKGGGQIMLAALALVVIGYLGQLMGRIIQSAVSRQREYLADASAVQFTRNPDGIAAALKKIGGFSKGSLVKSPNAPEASHMFFSLAIKSFFATHPPLDERIRRIDPAFTGVLKDDGKLAQDSQMVSGFDPSVASISASAGETMQNVGTLKKEHVGYSSDVLKRLPKIIRWEMSDIMGAMALICAMLLDEIPEKRERQLVLLAKVADPELVKHTRDLAPVFRDLSNSYYYPIIELSIATLRRMSPAQYARFKEYLRVLVEADGKMTIYEFTVRKMITHHLGAYYSRTRRAMTYRKLDPLVPHIVNLLAMLASAGHRKEPEWRRAFDAGMTKLKTSDLKKVSATPTGVSFGKLDTALNNLTLSAPKIKKVVFEACCACVLFDRKVSVAEAELLRLTGSILDIPVPPFLQAKQSV